MNAISKYISLIQKFFVGDITVAQFEYLYLDMFKNENEELPEDVYEVLNTLFLDVDAYCEDPSLRVEGDLDEESLRVSAKVALDKLV
jgi:hypothetical protein